MENKMPEILAPAGGMEQLIAAVRCGADAVYLGTNGFNARQNAKNFGDEELSEAVSYCHARNVAVHVTLNTLVFDDEIRKLYDTVEKIAMSGADAVIVQDIAVAKIIRECCPNIALHASTQMTIHNTAGAKAAGELGFSRAVLARELTLEEIQSIAKNSPIETEVFVHGALCTCVSGACYLSAMLGGRSGNRGYCAQPCRLNFSNRWGREYALSLKDMSLVGYAGKLCEAGVSSFKIEGRMKRPEYVAAAVTAVRAALDGKTPDMDTLEKVFSRSGFTDGYITGKRNVSMYGFRRKEDVEASTKVLGSIASLYRAELQKVPVNMEMTLKAGENMHLTVTDGTHKADVYGDIPENAVNKPIDADYTRKLLSKTGGTPFWADSVDVEIEGNITASASQLNLMRRCALEKLTEQRSIVLPHKFTKNEISIQEHKLSLQSEIRLRFENYRQASDCKFAERVIMPLDEILSNKDCVSQFGKKLVAEIPPILWENDSKRLSEKLLQLKDTGVNDVMCSNIGALLTARAVGCTAHGDYGLNILNSVALEEYEKLGLIDATLSFETGMNRIKALKSDIKRGIIAYGYLPLMKLRMCPAKGDNGCGTCPGGKQTVTDKTGVSFPLLCKNQRYTELLNSVPLYVGDKKLSELDFVTLYFTFEDRKTVTDVIRAFLHHDKLATPHTNGLYFRNVL